MAKYKNNLKSRHKSFLKHSNTNSLMKSRKMTVWRFTKKQLLQSMLTGLPQIIGVRGRLRKFLKSLVVLGCLLGCVYQILSFMKVYWSYPGIVDVFVSNPSHITPPAFTVCEYNGIRRSRFCSKFSELCTPKMSYIDFCNTNFAFCRGTPTEPKDEKWSLYAVEDIAIPARSAAKVPVVCRNSCHNFDVIVEENKNLLLRKEVVLPSSIVTLHDGRGVVWITNGQSASQIVPAGMSIGVAEVLQRGSINSINTTHFAESPTPCTTSKSTSSVDYLSMLAGDLTFDQKETLLKVFEGFSDIFDDSRKPQATRNALKHRINTEQHPPVSQGAYRVSATERQNIREEVTKMLKKGVV
ncbi:hypothetical protein JTE90_016479 [Oedothorax gibbosus]|uniref:Uncharacterized protein n=1 Tax=Oedothorax gibbosus TaxID=931172 RepID=A0AAV6V5D3_9ARAC|nr:hypothetical protein JTE90_016479 [Oedothorax gibbosus]